MKPAVGIQSVTKRFGSDVTAVDNVSLDIVDGEFFSLLGPSGCGKTTMLRMIAGLEFPTEGSIQVFGEEIHGHRVVAIETDGIVLEPITSQ